MTELEIYRQLQVAAEIFSKCEEDALLNCLYDRMDEIWLGLTSEEKAELNAEF